MSQTQFLFSGFGGQGILFAGKFLAYKGLMEDRQVSWLPSYGPEMRGGTASCSVILSDEPVGSPIVGNPNILMVMNAPSLDKLEDTVQPGGKIFVDSSLITRPVRRTDVEAYYIPATQMAKDMNMPGLANMIMLGLLSWTGLARMIRGQVLAEREKEFVIAAQSMGVKESRIAFKHILPNVISIILVNMTLSFASCLLTESSLSYLGFGVQQPQPTWGNMLYGANNSLVIQNYWWQWVFPAIFLAIATISINIIGDTLRDVLDPKSSQER